MSGEVVPKRQSDTNETTLHHRFTVSHSRIGMRCAGLGYRLRSNNRWLLEYAGTWTPAGGPPATNDRVYIGSNHPSGAAGTATVTLNGNAAADSVVLGRNSGNTGTLNLANHVLTLSDVLTLGESGGTGSILRGTGYFTTLDLSILNGNSLNMSANDIVSRAASINGTNSRLTLGDSLTLTGNLDLLRVEP